MEMAKKEVDSAGIKVPP